MEKKVKISTKKSQNQKMFVKKSQNNKSKKSTNIGAKYD